MIISAFSSAPPVSSVSSRYPYILLFLQGFYKQRCHASPAIWGVFRSPSPQQMVIIAKPGSISAPPARSEARRYAPFYRLWRRSAPVVQGIPKSAASRFAASTPDRSKSLAAKINHIAVRLTAEAVEASVRFQAGRFIFVEGAARHAVPSYMDSIMLRSLPLVVTACFTASNTSKRNPPSNLTQENLLPFHIRLSGSGLSISSASFHFLLRFLAAPGWIPCFFLDSFLCLPVWFPAA